MDRRHRPEPAPVLTVADTMGEELPRLPGQPVASPNAGLAGPPAASPVVPYEVIVLAGGGGTRLGGVDKAALQLAGRSLLDHVLSGTGTAEQVVVVGRTPVPTGTLRTMEEPPGGGPVAGIAAGLQALAQDRATSRSGAGAPEWTLVLAVDQPEAGRAVPGLLRAAATAAAGADLLCPADDSGHPQWLLAAYRTRSLQQALVPFGTGHGVSVRRLTAAMTWQDAPTGHVGDVDTWADHARWQERLRPAAPPSADRSGEPRPPDEASLPD